MKLIVGLGNPGIAYQHQRHNAGFMVVDQLAQRLEAPSFYNKFQAAITKSEWEGTRFVLMKPMTFMNNSGRSVFVCSQFFKIPVEEEMVVVYDDLDLPLGKVRFRLKGSHGGHNGVRSIIEHLGTERFKRIRLGIGRPPQGVSPRNYVLSKWWKEDLRKFNKIRDSVFHNLMRFINDSVFENTSLSLPDEEE